MSLATLPPAPVADDAGYRPAPIDPASRSMGPDLARGFLLLFIALANVWGYLYARDLGFGYRPLDGGTLDRVVDGLVALFVDDRSRPMFAILYGFGMAVMAARMSAGGVSPKGIRRVLRRRSVGLILLGVLHSALLFGGDILAPYGATGLVALALVNRRAAVLWRWFAVSVVLGFGASALSYLFLDDAGDSVAPTAGYLASALERLIGSGVMIVVCAVFLMFVPHVVVGVLVQRAGWLQRPWEHHRTLLRVFRWTFVVNLVLNLPWALAVARVWTPDEGTEIVVSLAHEVSGFAMGLGYVCLFGWFAAVWRNRPRGLLLTGVTAVGARSLSCYLLQSVAFAPLLSAWGLGWGQHLGTAAAALLAVVVWAGTVGVALALHRAGRRGAFEVLLRRLTYGRGTQRGARASAHSARHDDARLGELEAGQRADGVRDTAPPLTGGVVRECHQDR